jgi:hypothetical protein
MRNLLMVLEVMLAVAFALSVGILFLRINPPDRANQNSTVVLPYR